MSETTSEQLAEIEGQAADTPATEYTPPDGWRVLAVGEKLQPGDMGVRSDGYCYSTERVGYYVGLNRRYIRLIGREPQPEPEHSGFEGKILCEQPQPEPVPVQVREGRWRTRGGEEIPVTAMPTDHDDFSDAYPWWCGDRTWSNNGKYSVYENAMDLVEYLGPIEPEPQPETQPEPVPEPDAELQIRLLKQANDSQAETIGRLLSEARDLNMEIGGLERQLTERQARIRDLETMHAAATQAVVDAGKENDKLRAQAEELRSEVSYVQNLLGESRQRVRQLEELVSSLRTINDAQEKTVRLAGQENTDLQHRLNVVSAELVEQFETVRKLQIELDAAQQVPADSPELRQLRLDLAEVTQDRDTYRDGYDRVLSDLRTIRETAKAETVETIAEWLQPIKGAIDAADNQDELARAGFFAIDTIRHLPAIMRSLAGLEDEGIE